MQPAQRAELKHGWLVEVGTLVVVASPVLWGLGAWLDWPAPLTTTFKWLSIVLGVLVLISLIAVPIVKRRSDGAWRRFTPPPGLRFDPDASAMLGRLLHLPEYPFTNAAVEVTARHLVTGVSNGRAFATFTFAQKTERATPANDYQVVLIQLPARLPYLGVRLPLELTQTARMGFRIQIESDEFNRRYAVHTFDSSTAAHKYAVDVLNPRAVQALQTHEPVEFAIHGDQLVHVQLGVWPPEAVVELINRTVPALTRVAALIPQHTIEQFGRSAS